MSSASAKPGSCVFGSSVSVSKKTPAFVPSFCK